MKHWILLLSSVLSSAVFIMSGNEPKTTVKNPYQKNVGPRRVQSANTDRVDDSAARLWAIERRQNKKSEIPTEAELEGSGAEATVFELAVFALARPSLSNSTRIFNPLWKPIDV